MVRQLTKIFAALTVIGGLALPLTASAQEGGLDHCKFARSLALRIGVPVPNTATPEDIFGLLVSEGIVPKEGWECDRILTVGDFARVIVQVLERATGEVMVPDADRGNDDAFIQAGKAAGYNFDSIESTLSSLQTLEEKTSPGVNMEQTTTDPTDARQIFGSPDERAGGTDASLTTTFPNSNILQAPVRTPGAPQTLAGAPAAPSSVARVIRQLPSGTTPTAPTSPSNP